jgi:hypothetical protein
MLPLSEREVPPDDGVQPLAIIEELSHDVVMAVANIEEPPDDGMLPLVDIEEPSLEAEDPTILLADSQR